MLKQRILSNFNIFLSTKNPLTQNQNKKITKFVVTTNNKKTQTPKKQQNQRSKSIQTAPST